MELLNNDEFDYGHAVNYSTNVECIDCTESDCKTCPYIVTKDLNETNNFDLFKSYMRAFAPEESEFYFLQILIRGKDGHKNAGGNNKNRLITYYTIRSIEELTRKENEIIGICKLLNARAYVHPTKRNFTAVAAKTLELFPTVFLSNPQGLKGIYSTACGQSYVSTDKKYIIDLDGEDADREEEIIDFIIDNCEPFGRKKYVCTFPTVHGKHLIVRPFNVQKFGLQYPNIDVHKNNPTLLYYNPIKE